MAAGPIWDGTILRAVAAWLNSDGYPVMASAADPLPVAIAAGGADADVNIAAVGGVATPVGNGAGTTALRVNTSTVASASVSAVASQATNITLLALNAARRGVFITNTDANPLYVKFGATASLTSFTVAIPSNGYWEMPQETPYTGIIDGIWAADGSGSAYITEM